MSLGPKLPNACTVDGLWQTFELMACFLRRGASTSWRMNSAFGMVHPCEVVQRLQTCSCQVHATNSDRRQKLQ